MYSSSRYENELQVGISIYLCTLRMEAARFYDYWYLSTELRGVILDLQSQDGMYMAPARCPEGPEWSVCETDSSMLRTSSAAHHLSDGGDWSASRICRVTPGMGLVSAFRTGLDAVETR